jgi:hypothetical protein
MRLTLVFTTIIFTALLTYAKLLAIGDAPPQTYDTNGCRGSVNYSQTIARGDTTRPADSPAASH